jgi:hypothetical protein
VSQIQWSFGKKKENRKGQKWDIKKSNKSFKIVNFFIYMVQVGNIQGCFKKCFHIFNSQIWLN